ncbi:MAG: hypothetical protein JNL98_04990 [Bryobacterales bacterium]|nr:hypothetical protein [Bryobacterales bacterium]
MPQNPSALSAPAADLSEHLAHPVPMRRGSVGERFMKCSKPNCACSTNPDARHGPYHTLTSAVRGEPKSRYLTVEQATLAQQQIDAGKDFQQKVDLYWEVCQQWANQELAGSETVDATAEAVKKGGSKRASRKSLRRKSAS